MPAIGLAPIKWRKRQRGYKKNSCYFYIGNNIMGRYRFLGQGRVLLLIGDLGGSSSPARRISEKVGLSSSRRNQSDGIDFSDEEVVDGGPRTCGTILITA